jgi:hypothetical protein
MSEYGFGREHVVSKQEKKGTNEELLRSWIDTRENYAQFIVRCQQILNKK